MPKFPPPDDRAYMIINGREVRVDQIPAGEWAEKKMLQNIGRAVSEYESARRQRGI